MLHFEDYGRGDAVLLLHGTPSTTSSFAPLIERLVPHRRVLVPDLPGYGRSPALPLPYDLGTARRLLEDALLDRGIRSVAVLGYSGGSFRAFELALSGRVRVTRLASLGGFAGWDEVHKEGMRQTLALARSGFDFHPVWLARMMGPGAPERFPDAAREVMSWLDCVPLEVLLSELDAYVTAPDLRPRLRELPIPVLARVGELDVASPPELTRAIAAHAPNATLQVVPGCGHALFYEDSAATTEALAGFLLG